MRIFRPILSGATLVFRTYIFWLALGLAWLIAFTWPSIAAETRLESTKTAKPRKSPTTSTKAPQDTLRALTNKPQKNTTTADSTVAQSDSTTNATVSDSTATKPDAITTSDSVATKPTPNAPPADWVTPSSDSTHVLEDFEYPTIIGSYPEHVWEGRSGTFYSKTPKDEVYYKIAKEGDNLYLAAQTKGEAVNFGREAKTKFRGREGKANLRLYKKLRWRWRVHSLPTGSDEREGDTNDSAAAVRLVFGTSVFSGKSLKYIWSETLPVGTIIKSRGQYAVVLRSGKEDLGKWVWEEVNAYEDYRNLFGGDPRPVDVLGLLTDSNNTDSFVKADYDDITFIIPRPDSVEMVPDFMLDNP